MAVFKRSLKYITRNITKTILLALTFFLIGNLILVGIGITHASEQAKIQTRKSMNPIVTYKIDTDSYFNYLNSIEDEDKRTKANKDFPRIDTKLARKLASDNRIKVVNGTRMQSACTIDFDFVPLIDNQEFIAQDIIYFDEFGNEVNEGLKPVSSIAIFSNIYPNMIEFENGTYSLIEGSMYSEEDIENSNPVCLITKELADINGLTINDLITVETNINQYHHDLLIENGNHTFNDEDFQTTLKIIGIYDTSEVPTFNEDQIQYTEPNESPYNTILTPLSSIFESNTEIKNAVFDCLLTQGFYNEEDRDSFVTTKPDTPVGYVFMLHDPLDVDGFIDDYKDQLGEYAILDANNDAFIKYSRPLDTISFFSKIVILIVVINAIVVITLVSSISIKTRQHEIGVLLSIGASKFKIILQLFFELFVIGLIGFTLSLVSGSIIAKDIGEKAFNYQKETEEEYSDETQMINYHSKWDTIDTYFSDINKEDLYDRYEVSINNSLILEIYFIGSIVILLSIIIPTLMIMHLLPKQILLDTN